MQLKIQVSIKDNKIPCFKYRQIVQNLLKEALKDADKEYYNNLYRQKQAGIKPFTFSVYIPTKDIINNTFITRDYFIITVNTNCFIFINNLAIGLFNLRDKQSTNTTLTIKDVKMQSGFTGLKANEHAALVKTLEPILIKNDYGKYIDYTDPDFNRCVNYIANVTTNSILNRDLIEPIKLIPMESKVVYSKNVIHKQDFVFQGSKGIFLIQGNKQDLDLFLTIGLGFRTSQGFGVLEVLGC